MNLKRTGEDSFTVEILGESLADFEARDRRNHPHAWAIHDDITRRLETRFNPKTWVEGGKEYGRCVGCGQIVRLNKPLFGSLHFCG